MPSIFSHEHYGRMTIFIVECDINCNIFKYFQRGTGIHRNAIFSK